LEIIRKDVQKHEYDYTIISQPKGQSADISAAYLQGKYDALVGVKNLMHKILDKYDT
jgi:hypothetical protein